METCGYDHGRFFFFNVHQIIMKYFWYLKSIEFHSQVGEIISADLVYTEILAS